MKRFDFDSFDSTIEQALAGNAAAMPTLDFDWLASWGDDTPPAWPDMGVLAIVPEPLTPIAGVLVLA